MPRLDRDRPPEAPELAGDRLERLFASVGIDRAAKLYERLSGRDCGCARRKDWMNQAHARWLAAGERRSAPEEPARAIDTTERPEPPLEATRSSEQETHAMTIKTIELAIELARPPRPSAVANVRAHALTSWAQLARSVSEGDWPAVLARSADMRGEYLAHLSEASGRRAALLTRNATESPASTRKAAR